MKNESQNFHIQLLSKSKYALSSLQSLDLSFREWPSSYQHVPREIITYPIHRLSYLVNSLATYNRPGKIPSDELAR